MASYVVEQKDKHSSIKLTGDLTAELVPGLQAALKSTLEQGATELLFDLQDTVMLDSSGMGLLIATSNSLSRVGGRIQVINVSPDILQLLQCMRLAARLNVTGYASKESLHG